MRYLPTHIPGDTKELDGTMYIVSPKGPWIRQTSRVSRKASHRAEVKARKEKKAASKAFDKLENSVKNVSEMV